MAIINLSGSISTTGASILGSYNPIFASDANHTLSATEYTNKYLNVTSSVSLTTTRQLIAPLNQGQEFVIQNNTSGGQAILVIGSTGNGVTVPSGATVTVTCDGTNYLVPGSSSYYVPINVLTATTNTPPTQVSSFSYNAVLPTATINVVSAAAFPTSGNFVVQTIINGITTYNNIAYTNKTGNSFTGCTGGTVGAILTSSSFIYKPYITDSTTTDYMIVTRSDLGGITFITLPPIVNGRQLIISDIGNASLSPLNYTVILAAPGQLIGSVQSTNTTYTIETPSASVTLVGSAVPTGSTLVNAAPASLPQSVIPVLSTNGFPSSGIILITSSAGLQVVAYTGISGPDFIGCTGGAGTINSSSTVVSPSRWFIV